MGVSEDKTTLPFSTPTKPCSKLTSSVEAKENRLTSPNISTQKKHSTKRFMSPTISAASKAVTPRKKILAERNSDATEPSCVTNNVVGSHLQRSQSFDLKQGSVDVGAGSVYSSAGSLSSRVSEVGSVGGGEDGAKVVTPYDPVFNYLSPRPKYLLYNPNRRSEILNRYEMVDSGSSESENSTESEESSVKTNEEVDEKVGESVDPADLKVDEQADLKVEKVGGIQEKVERVVDQVDLKVEGSVDQTEGGDVVVTVDEKIEEHFDEAEPVEELGISHISVTLAEPLKELELLNEADDGVSEALMTEKDGDETVASIEVDDDEEESGEFEEEYEGQSGWSLRGVLKAWFVFVLLGLSTLYISSMNSPSWGVNDEYWWTPHEFLRAPSTEVYENGSGYVIQSDLAQTAFVEASQRIMDGIFAGEDNNDVAMNLDGLSYEATDVADLGQMANDVVTGVLTSDVAEVVDKELIGMDYFSLAEDAGNIVDNQLIHAEDMTPAGSIQSADGNGEVIEPQTGIVYSDAQLDELPTADDQFETSLAYTVMGEDSDAQLEALSPVDETTLADAVVYEDYTGEALKAGDTEVESAEPETKIPEEEASNNLEEAEATELATSGSLTDELTNLYSKEVDKTVIFSRLTALLLALLGFLGFRKMKKTTTPSIETTEQVDATNIRLHQVKQAYSSSYSRPAAEPEISLSHSFRSGLGAPRVALLGEFTVGEQEASSFHRRTYQTENTYDEAPFSFSQRNMTPAASGFSSTTDSPPHASYTSQRRSKIELPTSSIDSPSYGSFTTEMMIRKREEAARGGEKVIVTPVRRSSRIRGRGTPVASQ